MEGVPQPFDHGVMVWWFGGSLVRGVAVWGLWGALGGSLGQFGAALGLPFLYAGLGVNWGVPVPPPLSRHKTHLNFTST